ncbi:MAG: DUF1592 domain-containing protein [Sandaracinus sp.]|nr:DUF1592 domain-containing protein [Sandaracinus sp.]
MTRLAFRWLVALALLGACDGTIGDPGSGPGPDGRRPGEPIDSRLEPRVWRLSPALYESELDRLFGEGVPDVAIPPGAAEYGITDIAGTARVDLGNASTFVEAARVVGTWASTSPSATRCADPAASTCIDTLLEWLPEEAFRRPVTNDERRDLRALYDALAAEYEVSYALGGVLRAVLLSPEFLYRTELGGAQTPTREIELDDHEIATLLAFALTDRAPDAELLAAADAGRLSRPDEREAQARRLMDESGGVWARFFWEWLKMATLQSQANEVELDPELAAQMDEELHAFVSHVIVDERGSLRDLMTASYSWTRPELAAHYGASHPGAGLDRVELDPNQRGGLLTRGAWLVAHGKRGRDNVVRRGMGVFIDAMCNDIRVPADLDVIAELDRLVGPDATVREVTEARGNAPVCGNCHQLADPVGLAFENFASDGSWQTTYADGNPVESQIVLDGTAYDDAGALSEALASDTRFQRCLVRRFAHFALGADLGSPAAVAWTADAHAEFVESDTSFEELVVALVRHPAFLERRKAD